MTVGLNPRMSGVNSRLAEERSFKIARRLKSFRYKIPISLREEATSSITSFVRVSRMANSYSAISKVLVISTKALTANE